MEHKKILKIENDLGLHGRAAAKIVELKRQYESELYFRIGQRPHYSSRIPNRGTINLEKNEVYKPQEGLTLYTEFVDAPDGGVVNVPFHLFERDPGKNDDEIIDHELAVPLGSSDYKVITQSSVKVKLKISGLRSRY